MSESLWIELTNDSANVGDVVRVKQDAYKTTAGKIHNGRLVKVTGIRGGDVLVTSIDMKLPYIFDARHPAHRLEKKALEL